MSGTQAGLMALVVMWVVTDDLSRSGPDAVVGSCKTQGFQDIHYSATFRMPRADVPGRLEETCPGAPASATEFCGAEDVDLCLDPDRPGGHPDVRLAAFTM